MKYDLGILKEKLLKDMATHPERYTAEMVKILFNGASSQLCFYNDDLFSQYVGLGGRICREDLMENNVIPDSISTEELFQDRQVVRTCHFPDVDLSTYKGTDVIFLGEDRSGKTTLIQGLVNSFARSSYIIHDSIRDSLTPLFVRDIISSFHNKQKPCCSYHNSIGVVNIGINCDNSLSLIDTNGHAFHCWAEDWESETSVAHILKSKNKKIICFVIDPTLKIKTMAPCGLSFEDGQKRDFENAIAILEYINGYNSKPMAAQINAIAIIITKIDMLKRNCNEPIQDMVKSFIKEDYLSLYQHIERFCEKFGINKASNYRPYIIPYSYGDFYIGDANIHNPTYSDCLRNFILENSTIQDSFWNKVLKINSKK